MRRLLALLSLTVLLAACAGTDADGVPVANPASGFGDDVADVSCDGGGHDAAYHIHSQLVIYLPDGTSTDVPANIGIGDRCMYNCSTLAIVKLNKDTIEITKCACVL